MQFPPVVVAVLHLPPHPLSTHRIPCMFYSLSALDFAWSRCCGQVNRLAVCVEAVHQKVISATNEPNTHTFTYAAWFFCSVVRL